MLLKLYFYRSTTGARTSITLWCFETLRKLFVGRLYLYLDMVHEWNLLVNALLDRIDNSLNFCRW